MSKYPRILLKLSGESLGGPDGQGIDAAVLEQYAAVIARAVQLGTQIAIVVGGGNIFRGLAGVAQGFDRVAGDKMGMLATTINSLALCGALESKGVKAQVFSATPMESFATYYRSRYVIEQMQQGVVALVAGGTGNPFFTTDSASALRAVELQASAFLKGTRVDGVYTADPEKDPLAVKFDSLTFEQALQKNLRIMDRTAFTLCQENKMPVVVFDMNNPQNLIRLLQGESIGTTIA